MMYHTLLMTKEFLLLTSCTLSKLSEAFFLSAFEQQIVKFVLKVVNELTIAGLKLQN